MRDTFGWLLFRVIGNSLKFPITQKGTNVPMMRTRAKQKHVASDRARRENVPRHILFGAAVMKPAVRILNSRRKATQETQTDILTG